MMGTELMGTAILVCLGLGGFLVSETFSAHTGTDKGKQKWLVFLEVGKFVV